MINLSSTVLKVIESMGDLDSSLVGKEYFDSPEREYLDRVGGLILYRAAVPIMAMARMAVFMEDGSPTVIQLDRVGKNGVIYKENKIRSMVPGTENQPHRTEFKLGGDPAITKVGQFIRKRSIDELPQLMNVRRGEMSIVGPRPVSICEFADYTAKDSDFEAAYTLGPPGMTGLAQVNGRELLSDAERREFVKEYASEASLALDIDILLKTAKAVVTAEGAY